MEIYTIGFAKKTAEQFFGALKAVPLRRLIDVRRNNSSQLAGFTKRDDLPFFLRELCGLDYVAEPLLAPDEALLRAYRKKEIGWAAYEERFVQSLREHRVEEQLDRELFAAGAVLLCSEPAPKHCHRRLVAEYLCERWGNVEVVHL